MSKRLFLVIVMLILVVLPANAVAQENIPTITVDLTPYEGNPALLHGEPGAWNELMWYSRVIYHDGVFHMLYHGYSEPDLGIGYATSEDGLNWTPYEGNPVFESDPALGQYAGLTGVTVEGDTWVMYVCAVPYIGTTCNVLYRATAPDPTATWSVDPDPLLEAGVIGDWDSPQIWPSSLVETDEGYVMYYHAQEYTGFGMATSADGITWTKYNDLATTEGEYKNSDPVMTKDATSNWELPGIAFPCVQQRDGGWEMFYFGSGAIGYATSMDGITWSRFLDNPVLTIPDVVLFPDAVVIVDDVYYLYYTVMESWDIGVATGTVTWK